MFPGMFKDAAGNTYDLRPMETCPSLNNFTRMDKTKLQELLKKAYDKQIETLETLEQPYDR